jgi:hypothetical protein
LTTQPIIQSQWQAETCAQNNLTLAELRNGCSGRLWSPLWSNQPTWQMRRLRRARKPIFPTSPGQTFYANANFYPKDVPLRRGVRNNTCARSKNRREQHSEFTESFH